jgi:hypothetical protein
MAQALTGVLYWQERLSLCASVPTVNEKLAIEQRGGWEPPRVTESQATEQAAAMAERFHRMFLRSLRTLQDLRRRGPAVVVQNVGQVKVAGKRSKSSPRDGPKPQQIRCARIMGPA